MDRQAGVTWQVAGGAGLIGLAPQSSLQPDSATLTALDDALARGQDLSALIMMIAADKRDVIDPADLISSDGFARLLRQITETPVPVIAVLMGKTLGAFASLAVAAHGRVALGSASLAWPEAGAALLPAGAAVMRVSRLAGVEAALDLLRSGRRVTAPEAQNLGLVDEVAEREKDMVPLARHLAQAGPRAPHPVDAAVASGALQQARAGVATGREAALAPARLIDCLEASLLLPEFQTCAFAAEAEADAVADPVGQALRHLIRAEQGLSPGLVTHSADGGPVLSPAGLEVAAAFRAAWVIAAQALLREGWTEARIDAAACDWGFAKGPLGTARAPQPDAGITRRLHGALLAEAARLVTSGKIATLAEGDALAVMATGFPRWRGGPVFASLVVGQVALMREMADWTGYDPVWELPEEVRHAILVTGQWGARADRTHLHWRSSSDSLI